uniref:Uncharacterized protein n=1 Tax=Craspedostauros australis TaxID=1486917 RepID=A0A7R9WPB9_9STRA
MLNDEVEILEMQKQHLIKAKEQTAITKDVNDFAFPVSDNDDNSSCVSHATPVSAKRTPNKKTTPARKSISSKRRQPTSPKKWRRMIRSQRLQSIFYA